MTSASKQNALRQDQSDDVSDVTQVLENWDDLDAFFDASENVEQENASENDDELKPIDPIDEEILDYLDGRLDDSAKILFEEKLENDSDLRERLESQRSAWRALDALDLESTSCDLTEATVDKLNAETRAELEKRQQRRVKSQRRLQLIEIVVALAVIALGYLSFSALFPSVADKRERDCRVVERLAQLEAAQNYDYLLALNDSNLLAQWRELCRRLNAPDAENVESRNESRSYQELLKDRAFYRLQERFEQLDKPTQDQLRRFLAQIEQAPNSDELLQTLDDYAQWLKTSTIDSERERLASMSIHDRLNFLRGKVNETRRFVEFFDADAKWRPAPPQGSFDFQARAKERDASRERIPDASPTSELRAALPPVLRDENLAPLYRSYLDYTKKQKTKPFDNPDDNALEFVAELAASTDSTKNDNRGDSQTDSLPVGLSDEAKEYLGSLDSKERSSVVGMLLSLSFVENSAQFQPTRPFSNRDYSARPARGGRRNPRGNENRSTPPRDSINPRRPDSIESMAGTLRESSKQFRDYVTSCPAQEARGLLLGASWARFGNNPREFNPQENVTTTDTTGPQRQRPERNEGNNQVAPRIRP